jgi:uroporphyrin-III C-methyltransferase
MGIKNLPFIIDEFRKHKSDSYPIAIIQNGTMPNEKVVLADLEHIEQAVEEHRISNPALIVIGSAASYAKTEHYSSYIHKQLVS